LSLNLRALSGQLLLLVGQCLLHQHHLDALLHGVLLRLADQVVLLRGELGQGAAQEAEERRTGTRTELDIARLLEVVQGLRKVGNFRIRGLA